MNSQREKTLSKRDFRRSKKEIAPSRSLPNRSSGNRCPDCNERLYRGGWVSNLPLLRMVPMPMRIREWNSKRGRLMPARFAFERGTEQDGRYSMEIPPGSRGRHADLSQLWLHLHRCGNQRARCKVWFWIHSMPFLRHVHRDLKKTVWIKN